MQYSGRRRWNMLLVGALMFFRGRFTGYAQLARSREPAVRRLTWGGACRARAHGRERRPRGVLLTFGPSVLLYAVLAIVISMTT